jgi:hypothetical protein
MQEGGKEIIAPAAPMGAAPLDYAPPAKDRHHSVWSVVGFGLAGFCLVGAALPWWHVWSSGAISTSVTIGLPGYFIPLLPICLCLIGLRHGRRVLAIAGIVVSLIALIAMIVVVAGSPW